MVDYLKQKCYFFAAWYFRFWAQIKLSRWKPRIIVVTGSSGKTTLLHFVESQLGNKAKYSHHANSSIGIPFDILGIERHSLKAYEWIRIIISAPVKAFSSPWQHKIYVAECDCDRPGEGKFLAEFLKPEVTLWISLSRTHTMNFDHLVSQGWFTTVEEAIAYEYGYFAENSTGCVIYDVDIPLMKKEVERTKAQEILGVSLNNLQVYYLGSTGTTFRINYKQYTFKSLQPKEIAITIQQALGLMNYLQFEPDEIFSELHLPPGRSTSYKGIKNTRLIDSSYNANLGSMNAILSMYNLMEADEKWVVLGDMKELGNEEKEEHEKLGAQLLKMKLGKVILLGPAVKKYTFPYMRSFHQNNLNIICCQTHKEALDYIKQHIKGGETILFKSSQSQVFEGFIENLLESADDAHTLPRREKFWIEYRKQKYSR